MSMIKAFSAIEEKSLFNFLDISDRKKIFSEIDYVEFQHEQEIVIPPDNLVIVASGSVNLIDPYSGKDIGTVIEGRAISINDFLVNSKRSKYDLKAIGPTSIFLISRTVFKRFFNKLKLEEYLLKITTYPELRKFKNDLTFLGYDKKDIVRLIAEIELVTTRELSDIQDSSIIVIHTGSMTYKVVDGLDIHELSTFSVGDCLRFEASRDLVIEFENLSQWVLDSNFATKFDLKEIYGQLVKIFDPISKEYKNFKKAHSDKKKKLIIHMEDDDFTVADFKKNRLQSFRKRKPVCIRQHDQMDCGAACMSTIANYYGRNISVARYRSLIHITRDGASMFSMKQAAIKSGFDVIVIFSGFNALKEMIFPAICLMQYHFVVVFEIKKNYVLISDPAVGIRKVPIEDFKQEWSGNTMCLKPNSEFCKNPESANSWIKYISLLKNDKGNIFDIAISSILLFLFSLGFPLFMQFIFDNVLVNKDKNLLHGVAAAMVLFNLLNSYLKWCNSYLLLKVSSKMELKFSTLFLRHVLKLPLGFFAVRDVGDITSRITEIDKIREFITSKSISVVINLFSVFIYLVVIYLYSVKLAVLVICIVPLVLIVIKIFGNLIKLRYNQLFTKSSKMQSLIYEQIDGLLTIRSLNSTLFSLWKLKEKFESTLVEKQSLETIYAIFNGLKEFFEEFFKVTLLGAAIYLYMLDELTLGQVVAINVIAGSLIAPFISLFSLWDELKQVQVSFSKVDDIFTAAPEREEDVIELVNLKSNRIKFENVSFQYGSELSPVILDRVNLEISDGETVAFVGGSGSGKTTLAYMVGGLYTPRSGKILIDGVDIQSIPLTQLRDRVKVVVQESNLFSGSIIDNISIGDQNASLIDIIKAAKNADAHDFISKLPQGYNTKLNEKGNDILSGGQKQRISIARAFYSDPEILILDEATASLDALSEERIMENIRSRKGKTTIIIAHRLNTISFADKIIAMDEGQIVEQGTHTDLIKSRGLYYSLFKKQLDF